MKRDRKILERLMKRLIDLSISDIRNKQMREVGIEARALYRAITKIYYPKP